MSVSYTEVKEKELLQKGVTYGIKEFVHAKVEPWITSRLPYPIDHQFTSCYLPKKYLHVAESIFNFEARPDDVWVVGFPKSGTTWLSNIVWQLQHNFDLSAEFLPPDYMYLEDTLHFDDSDDNKSDEFFQNMKTASDRQLDKIANSASPRLIKSHLPAHFLPIDVWTIKPKLICVHREVKDVCCSMFHMFRHSRSIKYKGSIEDCFDCFLNDHVLYGPFHAHVKSYQQLQHFDHVLILTYEEMLANPIAETKRISEFLNYTHSDDQLKQLVDHVSFRSMLSKNKCKWISDNTSKDYVYVCILR